MLFSTLRVAVKLPVHLCVVFHLKKAQHVLGERIFWDAHNVGHIRSKYVSVSFPTHKKKSTCCSMYLIYLNTSIIRIFILKQSMCIMAQEKKSRDAVKGNIVAVFFLDACAGTQVPRECALFCYSQNAHFLSSLPYYLPLSDCA